MKRLLKLQKGNLNNPLLRDRLARVTQTPGNTPIKDILRTTISFLKGTSLTTCQTISDGPPPPNICYRVIGKFLNLKPYQ